MTKKRHQSIISLPKIVSIVTITLVAVFTIEFGRRALDNYHVQRQVEWLRGVVAAEEEENEALQERLAYVSSDTYVEEIARERLKMVKEGEAAVVVLPESTEELSATTSQSVTESPVDEPEPYWRQWWDLFFGWSS